jgi:metal-responsive CopG/Arc/MetJ family transcriptional regulator
MARPSINMAESLREAFDERRHAAVSRSRWFREAALVRLVIEDMGDDRFEELLERAEAEYGHLHTTSDASDDSATATN